MQKIKRIISVLILLFAVGFNLYINFPETQITADPNDNIFQYSLVARTDWIWQNYHCPLSPGCLPNLTDHVVTAWAEGYPLPFYYSHVPQITIVSSYHLLVKPLTSLFISDYSLYDYYNLTKYLLLCLFPVSVFLALRLVGFSPVTSALGSLFGSHFSTDGLYGIDPPSFLWRGYGLTSQLYAMVFFPLGLAFAYRAFRTPTDKTKSAKFINPDAFWAAVLLCLTTAGHLGIGMIALISLVPFIFMELKLNRIILRVKKLVIISLGTIIPLAYWIIPTLLKDNYHLISFWDPIWKFNSYGWYEVVQQLFQGEIFDWQRLPVITLLVVLGFFALALDAKLFVFAIVFTMWFLFYFGRTTWGPLLDFIPGMKDFHQHRFIVGIQIASLFLIPAGIGLISSLMEKSVKYLPGKKIYSRLIYLAKYGFLSIVLCGLAYLAIRQTVTYAYLNNKWIGEANSAYRYSEKNFQELTSYLASLSPARLYAGRPGNWGHDFRIGSTEIYMQLGIKGFDMSQFLPETWSTMSENEQNFDEREALDYDLLNIRYIVADSNHGFPKNAVLDKTIGPYQIYKVPTSGWFDVVNSPMAVVSSKTNFINLVHYWHNSYARRWKMHPLISLSVTNSWPHTLRETVFMKNEVSYTIDNPDIQAKDWKNIFADYPFVFPQSTVSGQIKYEAVNKQNYKATVEVPPNCPECLVMFKMSYHPNWKVKVDGRESEKYAVFPFYLAVKVPAGTHTVEFFYQPYDLKVILLASEIVLFAGIIFWYVYKNKLKTR